MASQRIHINREKEKAELDRGYEERERCRSERGYCLKDGLTSGAASGCFSPHWTFSFTTQHESGVVLRSVLSLHPLRQSQSILRILGIFLDTPVSLFQLPVDDKATSICILLWKDFHSWNLDSISLWVLSWGTESRTHFSKHSWNTKIGHTWAIKMS